MVKQSFPHEEQLASFVRCELSEEVAANILDHLDHCPHCEETVAKLEVTIKSVESLFCDVLQTFLKSRVCCIARPVISLLKQNGQFSHLPCVDEVL